MEFSNDAINNLLSEINGLTNVGSAYSSSVIASAGLSSVFANPDLICIEDGRALYPEDQR